MLETGYSIKIPIVLAKNKWYRVEGIRIEVG